jgi:putative DNA primase/helicase
LLNCSNGIVDLRTGELYAHSPGALFTYAIPTRYNPQADTTQWKRLVTDWVGGDQNMARYLQEAVGYSITGSTQEEIMFYLHGETRAGKGTFTETILAMLGGMPVGTEVDFRIFTQPRHADTQNFALAPLRPCRFVAASESKDNERLNAAKVKMVTGGNRVYCAHKGKDFFSYKPGFKIWLSSNYPVNADPDDPAIWVRLRVVPFTQSYAGHENKHLKRELLKPCNLEAVLLWAVQGARRWYARDSQGLETPAVVSSTTEQHRKSQDFVGQWIDECLVVGTENDFITNEQLYGSYKTWCEENGVMPKGKRKLTMTLNRKGYDAGQQKKIEGRNRRGCKAVKFAGTVRDLNL